VVDLIDLNVQGVYNVMVEQLKVLVPNPVFNIALASSEEIVGCGNLVTLHHQTVDQVGANKACTSSHQDPLAVLVGQEADFREGLGARKIVI
jgi:hypothetical protein